MPRSSPRLAPARRAIARAHAAIADGFRPVGVEFPAMGEHWVNLARVMADTLDPAMPPVLIYVMVNGKPQLGGVAFTDLLGRGESRAVACRALGSGMSTMARSPRRAFHFSITWASRGPVPATISGWRFCMSGRTSESGRTVRDGQLDAPGAPACTTRQCARLHRESRRRARRGRERLLRADARDRVASVECRAPRDRLGAECRARRRPRTGRRVALGERPAAPRRMLGLDVEGARPTAPAAHCRAAGVARRVVGQVPGLPCGRKTHSVLQ